MVIPLGIQMFDKEGSRFYWVKSIFYVKFEISCFLTIMAIGVVEFSREGYKIRKVFA